MLNCFDWTEKYRLDIPEIDEQHMELVSRVNNLFIAYNDERSRQEIHEMLLFLSQYVVIHFKDEEALMEKLEYPEFDCHHSLHQNYSRSVDRLFDQVKEGAVTRDMMIEVNRMLVTWLSNHIDVEDRRFAEYYHQKCGQR